MLTVHLGHVLDSLKAMPSDYVHCVVTSPPYWALRDYGLPPSQWPDGWLGCLGLETDPMQFIRHLVDVFDEVRRVLRPDGTLWLNMGDSYSSSGRRGPDSANPQRLVRSNRRDRAPMPPAASAPFAKQKEMLGMPWRVAFALSESGWFLRSECIWHKRNPMPETVSDRPSRTHEHVFLLVKEPVGYFYDLVGASVPASENTHSRGMASVQKRATRQDGGKNNADFNARVSSLVASRNMRTVWSLSNESLREQHFAAFPTALVKQCLLAGISPHGVCGQCGRPYVRVIESRRVPTRPGRETKTTIEARASACEESPYHHHSGVVGNRDKFRHVTEKTTIGWAVGCACGAEVARPRVLDPFLGSGTTAIVSHQLGADCVGCELNPVYVEIAKRRVSSEFGIFAPEVVVR